MQIFYLFSCFTMKLMRLLKCQIWYGTELKPTYRYPRSIKIVCKVTNSNMVNL
jgi:hypothetical protein